MAKHDWPAARALYVEGLLRDDGSRQYPILDEVARRFGVMPAHLRERASKEGWRVARGEFRTKIELARQDATASAIAKNVAVFDDKCRKLVEAMIGVAARRVADWQKESKKGADPVEVHRMAAALRQLQITGRAALGAVAPGSANVRFVSGAEPEPLDDGGDSPPEGAPVFPSVTIYLPANGR